MKKKLLLLTLVSQLVITGKTFSQNIAINSTGNTPDTSAMLDVSSTVKGFLAPRMTTNERNAIPLPATGLLIYNTTTNAFNVNVGTSGSPSWVVLSSGSSGWNTTGNSGTTAGTNFIGTTDAIDFVAKTNNTERLRISSTGFVGIGTNAPTNPLTVVGSNPLLLSGLSAGSLTDSVLTINASTGIVKYINSSRLTSTDWDITGNGSTNASTNFIGTTNSVDFVTRTNNTERMRITSAGKVGLGLTSPNYALHIHDATVSPSAGTWMQISNNASGSGTYDGFYYGVNASGAPEIWAENNLDIVTGSGTTNKYTMRLTPTGYVGINTTSPGSALDVKGTIRLSGSSSGYVGFAPAAAAGSTVYTLPSTDGSNGQQLTTNGSGTLSWAAAGSGSSGWSLTGNSGTSSSNYIGTSDGQPVYFKVNNTAAGFLGTSSNYTTSFGLGSSATHQSTAIGGSANASTSNAAVAIGYNSNARGYQSVAIGNNAQTANQNDCIAIGYNSNANSYQGIAIGSGAGTSSNNNAMAIGVGASATGYQATAIGNGASATAQNSTAIGNGASVSTANYISIGNTSVAAIRGQVGFTTYSDGRFKRNIKEDVHGLDFIMKLRPVTYNWDIHKFNAHARGGEYKVINAGYNADEEEAIRKKESITYTGFIAQEVDKAARDCNYNFSGVLKPVDDKDAYSVTYAEFVVPLVKATQELNSKVAEQQKTIDTLLKEVQELKKKVH